MPTEIADGSIVELQCGTVYQGTLDLQRKTNVTVKTSGTCGKAVLTVGQSVTGWTRHQGNVYSAPVSFNPAQVVIDAQPITLAHWPNRDQTWAKPTATSTGSLSYTMPNSDLAGATLVFRPFEWAIEQRKISAYADGMMTLAPSSDLNFDGYALGGTPDFYVEGKLWMLDEPGEWAVSGGRLYVWTPDGQSPEGRAWAAPDESGIDATNANGVAIEDVSIFGTANGIRAMGAVNLRVARTEIVNSSQNGILNSGGRGLAVDDTGIRNSRHDAIAVKWGGGGETITNSRIDRSGSIGMPTNAHAAINLPVGVGSQVRNNAVTNSGYIGIRFFRDATVSGNTVDGACLVLTDCGGLYSFAEDRLALNSRIDGNTIRNAGPAQRLAWGIFLDAYANSVTITNNHVSGNGNGMMIHNGYNHIVTGNTFSANRQAHIQMVESGSVGSTRNNAVSRNIFISTIGEESFRISSDFGTGSVAQFGTYDFNDYASASAIFANFNGEALDFAQWKSRTGQDGSSTVKAP
ncbi:MAG: right-handed parallel beta-helix repeat-containing protein [Herminiimonas sp.]|nr:right-handed parallel beta-helix repeat-containing protein [Herminiimonas sp.]